MTKFYAQPYDIEATGFYFATVEEYATKAKTNRNSLGQKVEEYEIQFIDGEAGEAELASVARFGQSNIQDFIDLCEKDEREQAAAFYRMGDLGDTLADALAADLDEGIIFESDEHEERALVEYAEQLVDDTGMLDAMPENLRMYFDYEAFARDLRLSGDVSAFTFNGTTYIWDNHAG